MFDKNTLWWMIGYSQKLCFYNDAHQLQIISAIALVNASNGFDCIAHAVASAVFLSDPCSSCAISQDYVKNYSEHDFCGKPLEM